MISNSYSGIQQLFNNDSQKLSLSHVSHFTHEVCLRCEIKSDSVIVDDLRF